MSDTHLDDRQVTALLLGEEEPGVREHLARCPKCQKELASWRRLEEEAGHWQPSGVRRFWVRQKVLLRVFPALWWRAALPLAAAALAAVVLVPTRAQRLPDVDAVLQRVDATLAADPLFAVADAEVVRWVVPDGDSGERSQS